MKKFIATSGMLSYILLVNAGVLNAQVLSDVTIPDTERVIPSHSIRHQNNFDEKLSRIALKLGLDPEELAQEASSGKTIQQILKDHGIKKGDIAAVLGNHRSGRHHKNK
ncbi:MAG TPA: hypothetical protein VG982_01320 [Candidatus Paceibacterota bacterium]|nr:hypothetical protein [Candidatus Paceibacterota bacterium]